MNDWTCCCSPLRNGEKNERACEFARPLSMASFAVLQSVPIASVDALVSTLDDYASRFGDAVPGASVQRSLLERTLGFVRAYEPEQDRVSREPPEEPLVVVSSLDGAHDAVGAAGAAAKKRGRGVSGGERGPTAVLRLWQQGCFCDA